MVDFEGPRYDKMIFSFWCKIKPTGNRKMVGFCPANVPLETDDGLPGNSG